MEQGKNTVENAKIIIGLLSSISRIWYIFSLEMVVYAVEDYP